MKSVMERRRFRRAELDVPVNIRPANPAEHDSEPIVGQVKDVSLAGVM
jgi:c-di-GMP-binding flagellar brake protein YcgR